MGFIRFVPKDTKYVFEGDANDPNDYNYDEFIFNNSELINVHHSYDSNFILKDHPRINSRLISFIMRGRGTNINCHHFLIHIDADNSEDGSRYEHFIKHLLENINEDKSVTIEYDFYRFGSCS